LWVLLICKIRIAERAYGPHGAFKDIIFSVKPILDDD
jgi:hypothetical protein